MSSTTPVYAIPYAQDTDTLPDYPALDQDQAEAVEAALLVKPDYYSGTTAPASPTAYRTIWFDTNFTPARPKHWTGAAWVYAGESAPILLDHDAVSGAASIISDGIFTTDFQSYQGLFIGHSSADEYLRAVLRTSGVDNAAASYANNALLSSISGGLTSSGAAGQNQAWVGRTYSSGTNRTRIDLSSPQEAVETIWDTSSVSRGSGGIYMVKVGGVFAAGTQFDGIKVYPDSGTLTGDMWWWGIPKA